ncbi:hypothetical protein SAMN04487819_10483 [Actinopolyspora alba]|uniref:DUF2000 domain-containing protein n=1 Tax=Actinopolyspora alba TaxID=673379 RepID=A0A1I1VQI1_9ACTN|nr:DUF2000 domain-containing protein [Actinopolyspora alba]SFD85094.1 hypothetical protein SAMN04487819_10483 [Actinopolyspora alba]
MSDQEDEELCVLVLDEELPRWLAANTTAVLGVALGAHGLIRTGPELEDAAGEVHPGIGTRPLPVLGAPGAELPALRRKAIGSGVVVIDFNEAARSSRSYDEYEKNIRMDGMGYLGIALHGPRKAVKSISGNLKSLR